MNIVVGPSKRSQEWQQATNGDDDALLARLVAEEPPGRAHFQLMVHINRTYRTCQLKGVAPQAVRPAIERVLAPLDNVRQSLSASEQRELDLGMMQWIRRASALSAVVGAGVTVDAGGPSWPALVRHLLDVALARGHEITEMRSDPGNTDKLRTFSQHVVEVHRFNDQQAQTARALIRRIDAGKADTEELMQGAELCLALLGQHLFADVTDALYDEGKRRPGPIHEAIAELSREQFVPDRPPHRFPGWEAIISYNFDDLQGEAIDALELPRVAWAMRGNEMAGDPNDAAKAVGQQGIYQSIFHLHGFTPRRFFMITHVRFVFSAAQYMQHYGRASNHLISGVLDSYLAHPIKYALYVGCSFADDAMNGLLKQAAQRLPGRLHYALLKWTQSRPFGDAGATDVEAAARRYLKMGVRPVWFERFDEIPALIRRLA